MGFREVSGENDVLAVLARVLGGGQFVGGTEPAARRKAVVKNVGRETARHTQQGGPQK
jgi:hypothetical protein